MGSLTTEAKMIKICEDIPSTGITLLLAVISLCYYIFYQMQNTIGEVQKNIYAGYLFSIIAASLLMCSIWLNVMSMVVVNSKSRKYKVLAGINYTFAAILFPAGMLLFVSFSLIEYIQSHDYALVYTIIILLKMIAADFVYFRIIIECLPTSLAFRKHVPILLWIAAFIIALYFVLEVAAIENVDIRAWYFSNSMYLYRIIGILFCVYLICNYDKYTKIVTRIVRDRYSMSFMLIQLLIIILAVLVWSFTLCLVCNVETKYATLVRVKQYTNEISLSLTNHSTDICTEGIVCENLDVRNTIPVFRVVNRSEGYTDIFIGNTMFLPPGRYDIAIPYVMKHPLFRNIRDTYITGFEIYPSTESDTPR